MQSFVYKWTDNTLGKLYIGAHKGTIDDGYICSSKLMKEEYNKRPEDFTREILSHHKSFQLAAKEEQRLLTEVDAKNNPIYYNQHNGNGNFILKKHSQETKTRLSKLKKGKTPNRPNYTVSEKTKQKISIANKGKISWLGKHHSEETKQKLSLILKGKPAWNKGLILPNNHPLRQPKSEQTKANMSRAQKGHANFYKGKRIHTPYGIFDSIKDAALKIPEYSYNQIDNMTRKRNADKYPDWYVLDNKVA